MQVRPRRRCAIPRLEFLENRALLSASGTGAALAPAALPAPLIPNNPDFHREWGLTAIKAPEAWRVTEGSPSTIIAVVDSGVNIRAREFSGRIWRNPTPGRDGFANDVNGWNFVQNNDNVEDENGHGTHVAGILGATGNTGHGVVGVDWQAKIMPVKMLNLAGSGSWTWAAKAIDYAVNHGARVINASWGGFGGEAAKLKTAIEYANTKGVVVVVSAGNRGGDIDKTPTYPPSFHLPNEIVVGASDREDKRATFSDYGKNTVNLFAPGVDIYSTYSGRSNLGVPKPEYSEQSGTSMAAPFVSGVIGLVAAEHPDYTATELIDVVERSVEKVPALANDCTTGGILDAYAAVTYPTLP